jgi:hypothetical protein
MRRLTKLSTGCTRCVLDLCSCHCSPRRTDMPWCLHAQHADKRGGAEGLNASLARRNRLLVVAQGQVHAATPGAALHLIDMQRVQVDKLKMFRAAQKSQRAPRKTAATRVQESGEAACFSLLPPSSNLQICGLRCQHTRPSWLGCSLAVAVQSSSSKRAKCKHKCSCNTCSSSGGCNAAPHVLASSSS